LDKSGQIQQKTHEVAIVTCRCDVIHNKYGKHEAMDLTIKNPPP
jgi:hypothetical protein